MVHESVKFYWQEDKGMISCTSTNCTIKEAEIETKKYGYKPNKWWKFWRWVEVIVIVDGWQTYELE
jgi:hypothetical protein